jgi:hypothetical protein
MLHRKYIKCPNDETHKAYKIQRNKVTRLKRISIRNFFKSKCDITEHNKTSFWDTIKPFFKNQGSKLTKVHLLENDQIVSDPEKVCDIFNEFFTNVGKNLTDTNSHISHEDYSNHASVINIKNNIPASDDFNFSPVSTYDVYKKLKYLNPKKASGYDQLPSKLLKVAAHPISENITPVINESIQTAHFPESLKYADVSPGFKKSDNLLKDNYRPISVLTVLSKVFEGIMADQLKYHFKDILSNWLSAYRTGYSCNNVLLSFVELLREALDKNKHTGCILMDLSKAFDCLNHTLLLAKLEAYNMSPSACQFIKSYLTDRKQRVKLGHAFSSWKTLTTGVPQGSILGPLLFNVFMNDIFFFIDKDVNLINYADDNTLVFSHNNKEDMVSKLENAAEQAIEWFTINKMKANPNKFQALYLNRTSDSEVKFEINQSTLTPDNTVKLLGVNIDNKLNFDNHISIICKKAGKQINALRRLSKVLNVSTKLKIYNSFIYSNFNYCPVVFNTFSIQHGKKLDKLQERALRFVFDDYSSDYNVLLKNAKKTNIFKTHLNRTAEQVFKVMQDKAKPMTSTFFNTPNSTYTLRKESRTALPKFNTIKYGKHSFKYMGAYIWNSLPIEIQNSNCTDDFKHKLISWPGVKCNCKYCYFCLASNTSN